MYSALLLINWDKKSYVSVHPVRGQLLTWYMSSKCVLMCADAPDRPCVETVEHGGVLPEEDGRAHVGLGLQVGVLHVVHLILTCLQCG